MVAGFLSRKWIISAKGADWFKEKFLHILTPVTTPCPTLGPAVPLFPQPMFFFFWGCGAARLLRLKYEDAAPAAMIGASNHFEVAIATATMLFGLSSGAALATVVGVLIEVPVMLMLVKICLKTQHWFYEGQ